MMQFRWFLNLKKTVKSSKIQKMTVKKFQNRPLKFQKAGCYKIWKINGKFEKNR